MLFFRKMGDFVFDFVEIALLLSRLIHIVYQHKVSEVIN